MGGAAGNGGPFGGFSGGMSMDDIFSMFGDIFGGHSGGFSGFGGFGGGGAQQQRRYRGSDLRVKVKLNLKEISTGVEKKFKLKSMYPAATVTEPVQRETAARKPVLPVKVAVR